MMFHSFPATKVAILRHWVTGGMAILVVLALLGAVLLPAGAVQAQTAGPTPTAAPPGPTPVPSGCPPLLNITKSVQPPEVPTGSQVTFTILVSNPGSCDANDVVVTDNVPSQFKINSVTTTKGTATINGQLVTVQIGTLAPGELVTITIVAAVAAGTAGGQTVRNVAEVNSRNVPPAQAHVDAHIVSAPLPPSGQTSGAGTLLMVALLAVVGGSALLFGRRRAAAR